MITLSQKWKKKYLSNECDSFSGTPGSSSATNSMDIVLAVSWDVKVDDNVNMRNVQASASTLNNLIKDGNHIRIHNNFHDYI